MSLSDFEVSLEQALKWEGGYSNHPDDPGGATNLGITQRTYNAWRDANGEVQNDVRNISKAEARAIYYERFWLVAGCNNLTMPLAMAHFDAAVNHGPGNANILLKQSAGDWRLYMARRFEFWTNVRGGNLFATFGKGWTRRGADMLRRCAELGIERGFEPDAYSVHVHGRPSNADDDLLIRIDTANRKIHIRADNTQ